MICFTHNLSYLVEARMTHGRVCVFTGPLQASGQIHWLVNVITGNQLIQPEHNSSVRYLCQLEIFLTWKSWWNVFPLVKTPPRWECQYRAWPGRYHWPPARGRRAGQLRQITCSAAPHISSVQYICSTQHTLVSPYIRTQDTQTDLKYRVRYIWWAS